MAKWCEVIHSRCSVLFNSISLYGCENVKVQPSLASIEDASNKQQAQSRQRKPYMVKELPLLVIKRHVGIL